MDAGREGRSAETAWRDSVGAIEKALPAATRDRGLGDLPSLLEIRELLRLFARLPSEDVRQTVLALLRVIVGDR